MGFSQGLSLKQGIYIGNMLPSVDFWPCCPKRSKENHFHLAPCCRRLLISGLDQWTGPVDWTTGLDYWTDMYYY